jgi:hypothetical protein
MKILKGSMKIRMKRSLAPRRPIKLCSLRILKQGYLKKIRNKKIMNLPELKSKRYLSCMEKKKAVKSQS